MKSSILTFLGILISARILPSVHAQTAGNNRIFFKTLKDQHSDKIIISLYSKDENKYITFGPKTGYRIKEVQDKIHAEIRYYQKLMDREGKITMGLTFAAAAAMAQAERRTGLTFGQLFLDAMPGPSLSERLAQTDATLLTWNEFKNEVTASFKGEARWRTQAALVGVTMMGATALMFVAYHQQSSIEVMDRFLKTLDGPEGQSLNLSDLEVAQAKEILEGAFTHF